MARNLIIDQGNSRAKVSVYDDTRLVFVSSFDCFTESDIFSIVNEYHPQCAIYCSVSRHGEGIVATLRRHVDRLYELTSILPLPIEIDYATPSTLGRDRVAAVAGAAELYPGRKCLVIDAGTAITYDILTRDRHFPGGNIAPGLWMRAKALHDMTSRLPMVDVETDSDLPTWGNSTDEAIRAGVVGGVIGEIEHFRRLAGNEVQTILTGGDAALLYKHLSSGSASIALIPDLVNIGLNSILLYNEQIK